MKRKAAVSNDEAIIQELRADPKLAAEYLKAAMIKAMGLALTVEPAHS